MVTPSQKFRSVMTSREAYLSSDSPDTGSSQAPVQQRLQESLWLRGRGRGGRDSRGALPRCPRRAAHGSRSAISAALAWHGQEGK